MRLFTCILFTMVQSMISRTIVGSRKIIFSDPILSDMQCIISNKNQNIFCQKNYDLYLKENNFLNDKKLISISPGGFKGFYIMGVCSYIKENYDMKKYIFSGASAGAWNSLFMTFKHDPLDIAITLLNSKEYKGKTIFGIEQTMKEIILRKYTEDDFDLRRLFIGVTSMQGGTNIYSDFDGIEDALDCCIASSHIPFLTGGLIHKYQNQITFDGGFSKYPYLNITPSVLHITPSMWTNNGKKEKMRLCDYTTLFSRGAFNFIELYNQGYNDTKNNKIKLDGLFVM